MKVVIGKGLGLIIVAFSLNSCFWFDEDDTIQLTDNYQLVETSTGDNFLYHINPEGTATEPLLTSVAETGVSGKYLVVNRNGEYYIFTDEPATDEAVRDARIGPLSKFACEQKIRQLTNSFLKLNSVP